MITDLVLLKTASGLQKLIETLKVEVSFAGISKMISSWFFCVFVFEVVFACTVYILEGNQSTTIPKVRREPPIDFVNVP